MQFCKKNYRKSRDGFPKLWYVAKYNTFPFRYGPEVLTNGFHSYSPLEMAKAEGHLETVIDTPLQKKKLTF